MSQKYLKVDKNLLNTFLWAKVFLNVFFVLKYSFLNFEFDQNLLLATKYSIFYFTEQCVGVCYAFHFVHYKLKSFRPT